MCALPGTILAIRIIDTGFVIIKIINNYYNCNYLIYTHYPLHLPLQPPKLLHKTSVGLASLNFCGVF